MKPYYYKSSEVKRDGSVWRIRRYDGKLVGAYETKTLAEKALRNSPWLQAAIAYEMEASK